MIVNIKNALSDIEEYMIGQDHTIELLRKCLKERESELYKDNKIQKLASQRDEAIARLQRGFGITKEEEEKIIEWQINHTEKVHHVTQHDLKGLMKLEGVSGGRWSYNFVPTAIGTFGSCRCNSCWRQNKKDAEFLFNDC